MGGKKLFRQEIETPHFVNKSFKPRTGVMVHSVNLLLVNPHSILEFQLFYFQSNLMLIDPSAVDHMLVVGSFHPWGRPRG